jgi:hypothetical protein
MDDRGALARVLRQADDEVLDLLAGLPGADLTTLLLEAMRLRAGKLSAPDVLRRYRDDRFATPASVPFGRLRRIEDHALAALPPEFEVLTLAPVAPLGTHSVLATVDQNKVVSTIRGSEVAADPTNAMALEAAHRRGRLSDPRSAEVVRLAALQRVVRAQRFGGRASFAHFALLGLVSAGRDTGSLAFERQHAVEHVRATADAVRACGAGRLELRLTVLDPRFSPVAEAIRDALPGVDVVDDPGRESGRGYYSGFCFKLYCADGDEWFDVADGGFVDWTQKLLTNRKERLIISGVGLDRLATVATEPPNAASAR